MKVNCPHCQESADVTPPERGCLLVRCGKCKGYFAIDCDGKVEKK